jgi:hypothetical protein
LAVDVFEPVAPRINEAPMDIGCLGGMTRYQLTALQFSKHPQNRLSHPLLYVKLRFSASSGDLQKASLSVLEVDEPLAILF